MTIAEHGQPIAQRILVGNIPEPDELYGRSSFVEDLWRMLAGNNVLLLAPRRFGKSGILRHVFLRPRSGYLPISFELEDVDSPEELMWRVTRELLCRDRTRSVLAHAKKLPSAIVDWVKTTFDEAGFEGAKVKFKDAIREDWREAGRRLLVELEQADETVVFLFDELPAMLDLMIEKKGAESAREFLAWFRTVRVAQKDLLRRHRFIVAGSVGIDRILRRLEASDKLVDFCRLPVEPLDVEAAARLAEDLAATCAIAWSPALSNRIFELIGPPVAYFVHIFFSQLAQLPPAALARLSLDDLDRTYAERVLGPTCHEYFSHFRRRLRRYGSGGERAAVAILRTIACRGRVSRPELFDTFRQAYGSRADQQEFDDVMADLECDWYVRLDPGTNEFHFRLKVMRDWWQRWHPVMTTGRRPSPPKRGRRS